jgi:3-deoxy-D-manno-octulosonate 8-phosphate phosphatase (KDO 8-P phosphatase)
MARPTRAKGAAPAKPRALRGPDYAALKLLVLDVDGVLTDGGLYVGDDGRTFKRYSILDGAGLVYWKRAGLLTAIISGHASDTVRARFESLGVDEIHVGVKDKLAAFEEILARRGLTARETAAIGDDFMDLPVLRRAGFSAAPPHAHPEVLAAVGYVTKNGGGRGCVREVVERLLVRAGRFDAVVAPYRK